MEIVKLLPWLYMKKDERGPRIIELWKQEQPKGQRSMDDLLSFHGWLAQEHSDLLPSSQDGDPYQQLKSVLKDHIEGEHSSK